jgi:XTP/dITP diphosphohydrolase
MKVESMKELIFASGNKHKLAEIQAAFDGQLAIVSMRDLGFMGEIDEYGTTLTENAKIKSTFINDAFKRNAFADDTGLEIEALNGAPGVYSARYAGQDCSFDDNMSKVLNALDGIENRKAQFRTIMNLWWEGENYEFEGIVQGEITKTPIGTGGFGYDPIFRPEGHARTFAEMDGNEKNTMSHRSRAMKKLVDFLSEQLRLSK